MATSKRSLEAPTEAEADTVAERSEVGGVVNYEGYKSAHQLSYAFSSPCRSCRDRHALSYVGEKKGRKDSPLKGDFDSPFELSELKPLLKVFQAGLRQLKDYFLIKTKNLHTDNSNPLNDKGFTLDLL